VRIYVCGLTPSAQAHLGHARSFLFFDVLRRYLAHCGYRVTYVQNVTDIDDRSINAAKATGEDYHAIIDRYYGEFKTAMRDFGVLDYDFEPRATQYIPQIQAMIRALVESGHAYPSQDGIYYRVATWPNYGKLANRNIDELEAGARIEIDEHKEDPLDFALWKFAKPGEPMWAFEPFGAGRPGWHIECSAMSHALLDPQGLGFDIHGGGADLIFPHHENEIAQSEPLMPHPPMANVWVHGGLLLFDNRKMSKSLGNFEPLIDVVRRHDPQAIRLLFLQTGYRKVMNFTEESMAGVSVALERLKKAYRVLAAAGDAHTTDLRRSGLLDRIETALDDDMNTSAALAQLLEYAKTVISGNDRTTPQEALYEYVYVLTLVGVPPNESWLVEPQAELSDDFVDRLAGALRGSRDQLGEILITGATPRDAVDRVIAARSAARARKDWAASDRLRDVLLTCGVELKDSKEGTTWSVVATAP
jgi:cysteinyl-tRNA synthetase